MTRSLCPDRNSSINQLSDGLLWNFVQACIVCRGGVYICGSERNNSTTSGSLAMKFTSDVQCPFMNMTQVIVWLFPLVPRTFLFLSFFFNICSPKSKGHCLSGVYNLKREQHPLSSDPRFDCGKTCHIEKKKTFNRGKKTHKNVRDLRRSHRGGIPLPGQTEMQ